MTLDQLLRLCLGKRRIAGGILRDQLNLAAGNDTVALFEKKSGTFLLLFAPSSKRARSDREETDAQGFRRLPECPRYGKHADGCSTLEQGTAGQSALIA